MRYMFITEGVTFVHFSAIRAISVQVASGHLMPTYATSCPYVRVPGGLVSGNEERECPMRLAWDDQRLKRGARDPPAADSMSLTPPRPGSSRQRPEGPL